MTAKQKKISAIAGRVIITLVGIIMILFAVNNVGLFLIGKTTTATNISTSRREGTDSSQNVDMQYKWSISWTFDADGKEYHGAATVRGSAIGVKHGTTVHYYSFAPQINSLFAEDNASVWTIVLVVLGVFLIIVANKKKKKSNRYKGKTQKQILDQITDYNDSVEEFYDDQSEAKDLPASEPSVPETVICPYCGSSLDGGVKFCPNCGGALIEFSDLFRQTKTRRKNE